MDSAGD